MIKITKFGGSSVADAGQFKKVKRIIEADVSIFKRNDADGTSYCVSYRNKTYRLR